MSEDSGDEQIRIELKKLVGELKTQMMRELDDVEVKAASTQGVTADQLNGLNEKMKVSESKASLRFQRMIDLIDRQ